MTEKLVPDTITRTTVAEVYAALRDAWRRLMLEEPSRASLILLVAHWAFETGRGMGMHCWNLGNAKHVPGDGRAYCQFEADEIIGGKRIVSIMAFRAFDSLEDGAADYLNMLRGTFRYAWPAITVGDPVDFSHRLKVARYYTADEAIYTRGIVGLCAALDREIPAPLDNPLEPIKREWVDTIRDGESPPDETPPIA